MNYHLATCFIIPWKCEKISSTLIFDFSMRDVKKKSEKKREREREKKRERERERDPLLSQDGTSQKVS